MPYPILFAALGALLIGLGVLIGSRAGHLCLIAGTVLAGVAVVLALVSAT